MSQNVLSDWLHGKLQRMGFVRKGSTWRYRGDGVITVVNLQPSQYGGQRYVNLGVLLTALSAAENPMENECHIRTRWESLADDEVSLGTALNLEVELPEGARQLELERLARKSLDAFLEGCRTLDGVKQLYRDDFFRAGLITLNARPILESD
jgi:hypothetical protein